MSECSRTRVAGRLPGNALFVLAALALVAVPAKATANACVDAGKPLTQMLVETPIVIGISRIATLQARLTACLINGRQFVGAQTINVANARGNWTVTNYNITCINATGASYSQCNTNVTLQNPNPPGITAGVNRQGFTFELSLSGAGTIITNGNSGWRVYLNSLSSPSNFLVEQWWRNTQGTLVAGTTLSFPINTSTSNNSRVTTKAYGSLQFPLVVGDYNGDSKVDQAIWRPTNGTWYFPDGTARQLGAQKDIPVPGDYIGDGKTDLATWSPFDGTWYIQGSAPIQWGSASDIPVPADYDGDGKTDLAVFRPSEGKWYIRNIGTYVLGSKGDMPVPADFSGDGAADLAVYRPSNSTWYISGVGTYAFGSAGDRPLPADYNGDGKAEIAVWRDSNSTWYIRGGSTLKWGLPGDIPAPGDYDGDRKVDFAVWRPSDGTWYVVGQSAPKLGAKGDKPLLSGIGATIIEYRAPEMETYPAIFSTGPLCVYNTVVLSPANFEAEYPFESWGNRPYLTPYPAAIPAGAYYKFIYESHYERWDPFAPSIWQSWGRYDVFYGSTLTGWTAMGQLDTACEWSLPYGSSGNWYSMLFPGPQP